MDMYPTYYQVKNLYSDAKTHHVEKVEEPISRTVERLAKDFKLFRKSSAKAAIEFYYGERVQTKILDVDISKRPTINEIKTAEQTITRIMENARRNFCWDNPVWDTVPADEYFD